MTNSRVTDGGDSASKSVMLHVTRILTRMVVSDLGSVMISYADCLEGST
jgi:hypothetical protein